MGKRLFCPRLAVSNLRKHHTIYRPYLLAVFLLAGMYYCLASLSYVAAQNGMTGGGSLGTILGMGAWLMGALSLLVLFYANSFLIRRRRREFGLYSVLGMEKRHICLVLIWEILLVAVGGTVLGMAGGALFSQAFLLLLQRLTHSAVTMDLWIPLDAVGSTAALFGGAFALVLAYDVVSILRSRPMELLRSDRQGEREPKARWLLAVLGAAALGGGYYMALRPLTAVDAFLAFLPAALLVMAGTYGVFTAGSIAVLKLMKRSRSFYYRPKNFLTVSTLLYRMTQNAAGLAAICILSTCVLVTVSTTVSLYMGQRDMLARTYPRMVNVTQTVQDPGDGSLQAMESAAADLAETYGTTVSNTLAYRVFSGAVSAGGGGVYRASAWFTPETRDLMALTVEDYNRCAGTELTLADGQVYVRDEAGSLGVSALQMDGWAYAVAGELDAVPAYLSGSSGSSGGLLVVVADAEALAGLAARHNEALDSDTGVVRLISVEYGFDLDGGDVEGFSQEMVSRMAEEGANVGIRHWQESGFYEMYGGLLFIGLFFTALFAIAVVLILYYKQITEGYDDHDRFVILQNVGLSGKEVHRVVSRQVLLMFYLPLAMAMVHIAVAFPALCKVLQIFQLYNTGLFLACTGGAAAVFLVFYLLAYRMTARRYFRIVRVERAR